MTRHNHMRRDKHVISNFPVMSNVVPTPQHHIVTNRRERLYRIVLKNKAIFADLGARKNGGFRTHITHERVNALRMRPDRIVVGEVRGEEALDMLQAMNTGHDGSLTTVHANTPRDALTRIETMIAMGNVNLGNVAMRQQISSAIQIIVQQTRLSDGSRS